MKDKLFYRIGEVARMTELKPYVLRYWETEFAFLAPRKTSKGQRIYKQADIDVVFRLKDLLHNRGFTIAGARRVLEDELRPAAKQRKAPSSADKVLRNVKKQLRDILTLLNRET